jgi:ribonuclease VapC
MVIDSSALIALLLAEPEAEQFVAAIAGAPSRLISAASYLETAIVMLARSGPDAQDKVDRLLAELSVTIVPFARDQAILGIIAYRQYGKGSGHSADLNFGDCFTYALAKLTGEPVLFKGNDFALTDIGLAVVPQRGSS